MKNDVYDVQDRTFFTFTGAYGEPWASWTTTTGERLAAPKHHIAAVVADHGDSDEDFGFG
jgi:hypothetical protein